MKYEKAVAEVIEFGSGVYFMATSGGCNGYGHVEEQKCYIFNIGHYNYNDGVYYSSCGKVENGMGQFVTCDVINCSYVGDC